MIIHNLVRFPVNINQSGKFQQHTFKFSLRVGSKVGLSTELLLPRSTGGKMIHMPLVPRQAACNPMSSNLCCCCCCCCLACSLSRSLSISISISIDLYLYTYIYLSLSLSISCPLSVFTLFCFSLSVNVYVYILYLSFWMLGFSTHPGHAQWISELSNVWWSLSIADLPTEDSLPEPL